MMLFLIFVAKSCQSVLFFWLIIVISTVLFSLPSHLQKQCTFGCFMKKLCKRSECWGGGGVEKITLGVREGAAALSEATIYASLYIFLCFALFHTFDRIYALFYILPGSNWGATFCSPIYIGTDSFGINYKLHKLGFEYGFSEWERAGGNSRTRPYWAARCLTRILGQVLQGFGSWNWLGLCWGFLGSRSSST